jgi:histidine triad (HIT) family protein
MHDPACAFCSIAEGTAAAHVVTRDDVTVSFLDARPLFKGHALVMPRDHLVTLADVPVGLLGPLFERVQRLSIAMESVLGAAGSFVATNNKVSQSVAHLHIHVVPRNRRDGLRGFFWPRTTYESDQEMADYAERLRRGLDA